MVFTLQRYVDESGFRIKIVKARRVLDSRGNPTLAVHVVTEAGGVGVAYAPSGASKGVYEALEIRDGGSRFHGKDVLKAIENVDRIIAPSIIGMDSRKQRMIDEKINMIDGTGSKSKLGANATVSTSLAVAKAAASTYGLPLYAYIGGYAANTLPVPLLNVINGGVHAGNKLDFQEYMIVPAGFEKFSEALRASVEVYHELKKILKERYGALAINVGDEGGFAPPLDNNLEPLNILVEAIGKSGYTPGGDIALALDVASSQFYDEEKKAYKVGGTYMSRDDMVDLYIQIVDQYPIVSIEDPLHESDFEGFALLTKEIGSKVLVVGDDLFVTNPSRLSKGIETGSCNAVLIKVNQIGTLTETIDVVRLAKINGYRAIVSHRSGETEDTTIADLAVGLETGLIKTGAPARGERTSKYNRLLEIEEELEKPRYPGFKVFPKKPC